MPDNMSPESMKNATHVIANKINDMIDAKNIPFGKRSEFASKFHEEKVNDFTLEIAADDYETAKQAAKQKSLADIDPLTGLFRKEKYEEIINRVLKEFREYDTGNDSGRQKLAITKLDIDLFSWWNDLGGQTFGDFVLQVIGSQIRKSIRSEDIAINRGGEEFVIISGKRGSNQEYESEIGRLIRDIRTFSMIDVLHILRNGQRKTTIHRDGNKLEERSSSIVLKNFAKELLNKTEPGGLDLFMDRGKGGLKKGRVKTYIESLKEKTISIDNKPENLLTMLRSYISDTKTYYELDHSDQMELAKRKSIEEELCNIIQQLYGEITVCAGLIIYTDEDRKAPPVKEDIDAMIDTLNKQAKLYGSSSLAIQVGQKAELVHINEVPAQMELSRKAIN